MDSTSVTTIWKIAEITECTKISANKKAESIFLPQIRICQKKEKKKNQKQSPQGFSKKVVLKNFAKLTGKHFVVQ